MSRQWWLSGLRHESEQPKAEHSPCCEFESQQLLFLFFKLPSFNVFFEWFGIQKIFGTVCSSQKKKKFETLLPPHYLKTYDFSGWLSIRNEIVRVSEKTVQLSKNPIQSQYHIFLHPKNWFNFPPTWFSSLG